MCPSNLRDEEWEGISDAGGGRPRQRSARQIRDAISYLVKTGWRQLHWQFPPWKQGYCSYWRWRERGVWVVVVNVLREQLRRQGCHAQRA